MSMKLGENNVLSLKLGAASVTKLALGANEVWVPGDGPDPDPDPDPSGLDYYTEFSPYSGGKALELYGWPSNNKYLFQWDAGGTTELITEIYGRFAHTGVSVNMNYGRICVGMGGLGAGTALYLEACDWGPQLRLIDPTGDYWYSWANHSLPGGAWINMVLRLENGYARGKAWLDGEEEPDWQVEYDFGMAVAGGGVGIGTWHGGDQWWDAIGVGYHGESAPRSINDDLTPNQRFTDFRDEPLGVVSGWTVHGSSGHILQIVEASTDGWNVNPTVVTEHLGWGGTNGSVDTYSVSGSGTPNVMRINGTNLNPKAWLLKDVPDVEDLDLRFRAQLARTYTPPAVMARVSRSGKSGVWIGWRNGALDREMVIYRRHEGQSPVILGTAPLTMHNERDWYEGLLQVEGDAIRAKLWRYGEPEPSAWMLEVTDPDPLPSGAVAIEPPSGSYAYLAVLSVKSPPEEEAVSAPLLPAVASPSIVNNGTASRTLHWTDPDGAANVRVFRRHDTSSTPWIFESDVSAGVETHVSNVQMYSSYRPQYLLIPIDEYGREGEHQIISGTWNADAGEFIWTPLG